MTGDGNQLKYMGTQSHETMAMEAALARQTEQAMAHGTMKNAADRAVDNARSAARAVTHRLGEQAGAAVQRSVSRDPIRVGLIAAGFGAVAMALVVIGARSLLQRVGAPRP